MSKCSGVSQPLGSLAHLDLRPPNSYLNSGVQGNTHRVKSPTAVTHVTLVGQKVGIFFTEISDD
jgi:hypothetical protein